MGFKDFIDSPRQLTAQKRTGRCGGTRETGRAGRWAPAALRTHTCWPVARTQAASVSLGENEKSETTSGVCLCTSREFGRENGTGWEFPPQLSRGRRTSARTTLLSPRLLGQLLLRPLIPKEVLEVSPLPGVPATHAEKPRLRERENKYLSKTDQRRQIELGFQIL